MANKKDSNDTEFMLKKSNSLLSAKYKTSSLAYDTLNYAMLKIQKNKLSQNGELEAILYYTDLNRLVNRGKNIYRDTEGLAASLLSHTMIIEKPKGFEMFNIVTNVEYSEEDENNKFMKIIFNKSVKEHLFDLTAGYGIEDISLTSLFTSYSTKKIYELIIVDAYKLNAQSTVVTEFRISELKFLIGIADINSKKVNEYLTNCKKKGQEIDWEHAYNDLCDAKDKTYDDWRDFRKRVLIPAQEDIKKKADYCFDFEPIREGREYKRIKFIISKNTPDNEWSDKKDNIKNTLKYEKEMDELLTAYLGHNGLTEISIKTFYKVSGYNIKAVKDAINLADKQTDLKNYAGWITDAIKNGRASEIATVDGSKEKADVAASVADDVHNNKEQIAEKVWKRYRNNKDMEVFLTEKDMTLEEYENAFSNEKRVAKYLNWKTQKSNM